jgi:hypothetical protein
MQPFRPFNANQGPSKRNIEGNLRKYVSNKSMLSLNDIKKIGVLLSERHIPQPPILPKVDS